MLLIYAAPLSFNNHNTLQGECQGVFAINLLYMCVKADVTVFLFYMMAKAEWDKREMNETNLFALE